MNTAAIGVTIGSADSASAIATARPTTFPVSVLPISANTIATAMTIIESRERIELLLTDVVMPGEMDGIGLSRWIFENRPNIPVILASGDIGKGNAIKDLCGAEAMAKPYSFDAAADKIRDVMEKRRLPPV